LTVWTDPEEFTPQGLPLFSRSGTATRGSERQRRSLLWPRVDRASGLPWVRRPQNSSTLKEFPQNFLRIERLNRPGPTGARTAALKTHALSRNAGRSRLFGDLLPRKAFGERSSSARLWARVRRSGAVPRAGRPSYFDGERQEAPGAHKTIAGPGSRNVLISSKTTCAFGLMR